MPNRRRRSQRPRPTCRHSPGRLYRNRPLHPPRRPPHEAGCQGHNLPSQRFRTCHRSHGHLSQAPAPRHPARRKARLPPWNRRRRLSSHRRHHPPRTSRSRRWIGRRPSGRRSGASPSGEPVPTCCLWPQLLLPHLRPKLRPSRCKRLRNPPPNNRYIPMRPSHPRPARLRRTNHSRRPSRPNQRFKPGKPMSKTTSNRPISSPAYA